MIVLALDTATASTSVALCELDDSPAAASAPVRPRRVVEHRDDPPHKRPAHARVLLELVDRVLTDAGVGLRQVQRLAVGTGPGTFTGLRIGVATAQGLALSAGVPLVGVSSLRALAFGAREEAAELGAERICAVIDARRGEVFAGLWRVEDRMAEHPCAAPVAIAPGSLAQMLAGGPPTLAVGDGALAFAAQLEDAVSLAGDPALHRVSAVWHCRQAVTGGPPSATVLPEYVRLPDAELARPQSR